MAEAPHWATVMDRGIVYAQGYCWCADAASGPHRIGLSPSTDTDRSNE